MKNLKDYIIEGWNPVKKVQPKTKDELEKLIEDTIKLQGNKANLNFIDTSKITDMSYLFAKSDFNGDIHKWNVSNVETMDAMFAGSDFNGDISEWNVSNVKSMPSMFMSSKFNGDIHKWDVSNVKDMRGMFYKSNFNQDISDWQISDNAIVVYMLSKCKLKKVHYPLVLLSRLEHDDVV